MTEKYIFLQYRTEQPYLSFLFYGNYWNNASLIALPQCAVSHVVPLLFDFLTLILFVLYKEILPAFLYVHCTRTLGLLYIWQKSDRLFCSSLTLTQSYGPRKSPWQLLYIKLPMQLL